MSVASQRALSEQISAVRVGVLAPAASEISTTALGAVDMAFAPTSAAEYDRGLGEPMRAAPSDSSQCEPVSIRSKGTAWGEVNKLLGLGSDMGET